MTLGSPVNSPQSPGFPGQQHYAPSPALHSLSLSSPPPAQGGLSTPQTPQPGSGYLPGFLMGDPVLSSPATPWSGRPVVSPTKLGRSLSTQPNTGSAPVTPLPAHSLRGPQLLKENLNSSLNRSSREKAGGPPTNSLLFTPNRSMATPGQSFNTSSLQSPFHQTFNSSQELGSGAGEASTASPLDTWITVWGFPPSSVSFILSELSVCGTVLQHVMPPNSNWMHVRMQTRLQASKAVTRSGAVLGGSIMVGISACREPSVLDSLNTSSAPGLLDSTGASVASLGSGLPATPRTIRPLTQAYKEAQADNAVVPNTNTPVKSSGFVSKAMEYMFGW